MRNVDRRALLLGSTATLLGACAVGDDFAEGTRAQPKGGIGGTGIVGTLTDFGSVIVNGLRIAVGPGLPVTTPFGDAAQDVLALGQNLTIEAETISGTLLARRIALVYPIVADLDAADAGDAAAMTIGGIPVRLEPGAVNNSSPGQRVAVSGIWNGGEIVASRLDPVPGDTPVTVSGTLRGMGAGGRWTIGAVPVILPGGVTGQSGSFATASGALADGILEIDDYRPGRFTGAAGALTQLSVEGYLAPSPTAPFQAVDGLGHSFAEDTELAPYTGKRTLFVGPYDGKFNVDQGQVLEEAFDARRRQLRV